MFERITIDAFNDSVHIVLSGVNHVFTSYDNFKQLTNFNFNDTMLLSYEPDRNIFVVERRGQQLVTGEDLPEIVWCVENRENIISAAHSDGYGALPPGPSLQDLRNYKLFETDWMVIRHRDQTESNTTTTLTTEQYNTLLKYRQDLRDITSKYSNLDDVVWPLLDI